MSESKEDKNTSSKNQPKEKTYNLVQTLMDEQNLLNITNQQAYSSSDTSISSKSTKNNTNNNLNFQIMKEMRKKILSNDYDSIKELLKNSSTLTQQAKNQLLNLSFTKYNLTNNKNQRKIILELINYGADANHKLIFEQNEKNKSSTVITLNTNIKITPLIYSCLKGDYELYELLKNKVNLNCNSSPGDNSNINKNYFFYFFENNSNMENKYKIAEDILNLNKNININEYDNQTGMTLLMISVKKQYIIFVKLFLNHNADVNKQNLLDGNTALHYAALVKNKQIIELFLNAKDCDLLIKNNNNETIVDVASKNNSTEIYALLASKYTEQQKEKELEEAKEELNDINIQNTSNNEGIEYINNIPNQNYNNIFNGYKNNNNNFNNNIEGNEEMNNNNNEGIDMIKKNQVNNSIEGLSSYIEIPFQFYNNFNYINHYDSNYSNNPNINNDNNENTNNIGNLRNYLRFKSTPILNINLKSEEDEDLLILDKLKKDNDELDNEYEKIENSLEQVYNQHSNLLKELTKINNEIKLVNNEIQSYSILIEEKDNKNKNDINEMNIKKKKQNAALDILLSQENLINLKNCHEQLLKNEEYLNKKFMDEYFDDIQIKSNLCKDIIDFQLYNKVQIKLKQKPLNNIRSSLQEILEYNGYDYNVYVFGSYATGLCLPWSDLDLVLLNKNQNQSMKNNNSVQKLQEIVNLLNNINWIDKPNIITDYYAFPYITFSTDEQHGFMKVNLTIQDKKNNVYKCVKLVRDFLNSYKNLEPLTLIVKQLMKYSNTLFSLSNYNNNSSETLNSYSIILMIVYFLQIQLMGAIGRTMEIINNPDRLGELFINFLLYYINFDYNEKNYIFVRTGLKDSLESDDYLHLSSFGSNLIIIDPLDHKNNLSLNTGEFKNIKIILKLIYYSCKVKCDCSCHYLKSYKNGGNNNSSNDKDDNNNVENEKKYVELGSEHCILKKLFQTAYRINSNLLKVFN